MKITKEEFDNLKVGDELIFDSLILKVELKLLNTIICFDTEIEESFVYTFKELHESGAYLKPKIKHLQGFPIGDYEDKNVFVLASNESLENCKTAGFYAKLLEVNENEFIISTSMSVLYVILISDNVNLIKE